MIDPIALREQFPMYSHDGMYKGQKLHYLDNCATTFKPYRVIEEADRYNLEVNANTKRGDYALAHDADVAYDSARETVARFINAETDETCFTSGDTMGLNQAAFGLAHLLKPGDEIVLSYHEHASAVLPFFKVAERAGARIVYVPLDEEGRITPDAFRSVVNERTRLVCLASTTNVLGYSLDVKEMARIAHSVGAIYIDDGAQSVPHRKTDVKDSDVDVLAFSGHKMCGPTGTGVMYAKREILQEMEPLMWGGEMNARFNADGTYSLDDPPARFEAGTQNVSGAMGLAEACRFLEGIGFKDIHDHEEALRRRAVDGMSKIEDITIYNPHADAGIVAFNSKTVFAQDVATLLGSKGVFVRSGTHCAKILPEFTKAPATVRASFYIYNDEDDVDALIDAASHTEGFLDVYFR